MIFVKRFLFSDFSTIGKVYNDSDFICYSLEDRTREGEKIYGQTAIPYGVYPLRFRKKGKFFMFYLFKYPEFRTERGTIEICDIPGFSDVLFHTGNSPDDSLGCILLGEKFDKDKLSAGTSTPAYLKFYSIVADLIDKGETYVTICKE